MREQLKFENTFLIIDYNNIRWRDVEKITDYVRKNYKISTTLIRPQPSSNDYTIVDHVLNLDFESSDFVVTAGQRLKQMSLKVRGGFVFSDRAMTAGSQLLKSLGILHDGVEEATACLNKAAYREREFLHREK